MGYLIWETFIQVAGVFLLAPLVAGIYENLKAKTEFRRGPSIFQPYYDLAKYLRKENSYTVESALVYRWAPIVSFSVLFTISFVIPVILPFPTMFAPMVDFLGGAMLFTLSSVILILGAIASNNNLAIMGASRSASFSALAEPTLILVFFSVALETGTDNPYITASFVSSGSSIYLSLTHLLSSVAFFMIFIFETGKLPVESSGLSEMGMIDEGRSYEYGGRNLFFIKYGGYVKQFLLGSVLLNVFIFPWFMQTGLAGSVMDVFIMIGKWIILILILVFMEQVLAKVRLFKIADFLAISFTMSILALVMFILGGFAL
ncbi:MAG: respiratory chain complex I subunit 1 family protein [Candidatus Thermoplasmatota archaeon]|nr:respiratory chain complex I subunit 1 family protein [Candidatus Thermoplasmatota archaeon]MCL5791316.1 respiratory chain complex I subunit 1 family protein [Candidatus Thermoplasmatota archaeon]